MTKEELEIDNNKYTRKINIPIYEPKNKKPDIKELFDTTKRDELIEQIDNDPLLQGDINKELRYFLKIAADRHVVFNFSKIADYYAHLPFKYKTHFEKSGLVIVDHDNAIRNGFVSYQKEIEMSRLEYVNNALTEEARQRRINKTKIKQLNEEKEYLESIEKNNTCQSGDVFGEW
jgi:transcriptional regulator of heat shock response